MSNDTPLDDTPLGDGASDGTSEVDVPLDPTSAPSEPTTANVEPTRLRRSRERRVVAGVAGGIAERFDVNENLIRIIFVVLTFFWGLGVAIYLVLWVVLRSADNGEVPTTLPTPTPVSTSRRLTIAVVAALVVLAGLAIAVAHPFRVLGPSLALAWIVFLVALAIIAVRTPARRLTLRRIAGIIFLVGASFLIIVVGAVIGFLDSTGVSLAGGNGDHVWQPTSLAQVAHGYNTLFGVGTLDVSAVDFPATGFLITASVAAGELRIVVPADAVVSLSTNVGAGVVVDTPVSIPGVSTVDFTPLPSAISSTQILRAPHLTIDARVGAGRIDLMRAASRPS
jgi:phage shock protein PspC (stress-responsive transcriptional regulator)